MKRLIRKIILEYLDTDEFIRRSRDVHGDYYDYTDSVFTKSTDKIKIICPKHGPFNQIAHLHYKGIGCPKCGFENTAKKRTSDNKTFIEKANKIHNNFYNYDDVIYTKAIEKIKINCPLHGTFELTPHKHLGGQGCPICSDISKSSKRRTSQEDFLKKSKEIHGDTYDYQFSDYQGLQKKVKIICPLHGPFNILPGNHYKGQGCPICGDIKNAVSRTNTSDDFITKAKNVFGDEYDYSNVNYIKSDIPVDVICKKHGMFSVRPNNHLNGNGCPVCRESKGEKLISQILSELKVPFLRQYKFSDCFSNKKKCYKLPFDFYIPDYNSCVEYDGLQHFEPVKLFGGVKGFKTRQILDQIKNNYCEKNNINLIRIPYTLSTSEIISLLKTKLGII